MTPSSASAAHPQVAVFVLNWNGREMTEACVRSLEKVTYPNHTLTVFDNGSTDGSADYLRSRFPGLDLIAVETNRGFTGGCNLAFDRLLPGGADYVCFVSNDVEVAPDFLDELVHAAEGLPDAGLLNPKIYYASPRDRIWYAGGYFDRWLSKGVHRHFRKNDRELPQDGGIERTDIITGCVFLVSRKALTAVGGFDDRYFNYAEDTDLSLRVRRAGFGCYYVPSSTVWHHESYDIRRNNGLAYQTYYLTRNALLVKLSHQPLPERLITMPVFVVRKVLLLMAYYLMRREYDRVQAILKAVLDVARGKTGRQGVVFR